jgi:hypothetical protein
MGTTIGTVLWAFVMLLLFGFFALLGTVIWKGDRQNSQDPHTRASFQSEETEAEERGS